MKSLNRVFIRVLALTLLLVLTMSSVMAQGSSSKVRFVHVVPNTAPVDVYINGTLAVKNLKYSEASTYLIVPSGQHNISVTPTGIATPLWSENFAADANGAATLIASQAGQFARYNDNLTPTSLGGTRLLLVHALAGGSAVDVQLAEAIELNGVEQAAGTVIAQNMAYGTSFGAFDLPSQTYSVNVVATGSTTTLVSAVPLNLASGTSYMAVVYGSSTSPQALLLASAIPANVESGLVRFVHGINGAPNVDIFANDTLIVPNLAATRPSEHMVIPTGSYRLSVREAGSETELVATDVSVSANSAQTVSVLSDGVTFVLLASNDNVALVSNGLATLSILNSIPAATLSISLSDGTSLVNDLAGGSVSSSIAIPPMSGSVNFTVTLNGQTGTLTSPDVTLYGGVYYNVVLLGGTAFSAPTLLFAPTAISQDLASAPGAGDMTLATGGTSSNTDSEVVVAPESQAVVQATPAAPQAVATGDEELVTGRVQLDPSANLQLRQYPDRNALSLGLAPSGTTVIVNGREGRPVALVDGEEPPAEAEDFVDPAELLEDEDADLDPAETWLNVTYTTPDGGEIVAWVLSQYLVVRDADGELQRLADLPTIGKNIPGTARNTELTPPAIPEDVVTAVVFNLNPGVALNIRRTPDTGGEVLERITNDTVVELLGFIENDFFDPEESEWVFVRYLPAGGGSISGWVSTTYVRYQWNGRRVEPAELLERGLMDFESPETVGFVGGGASQVALATPDPLKDAYVAEVRLDPGANLQFRTEPNRDSESINLIPSGTRLIVEGRNVDGDWVSTSFEGQSGWVSAQFLVFSFNGEFVDIEEIPVDPSEFETEEEPSGSNG